MCATCVAQGVTYVGGALGALQVMRYKARLRRQGDAATGPAGAGEPAPAGGSADDDTRLSVGPAG